MSPVLFLDFDGVLHPEPLGDNARFSRVALLDTALDQVPDLQVVVSSSWRHGRTLEQLRAPFAERHHPRFISTTAQFRDIANLFDESWQRFPREVECLYWLASQQRANAPWIALDDCPWLFRPLNPHLIQTDPAIGVREADMEALVKWTRRQAGGRRGAQD